MVRLKGVVERTTRKSNQRTIDATGGSQMESFSSPSLVHKLVIRCRFLLYNIAIFTSLWVQSAGHRPKLTFQNKQTKSRRRPLCTFTYDPGAQQNRLLIINHTEINLPMVSVDSAHKTYKKPKAKVST